MATPTPMHPPMTSINDLGVGILSRVLRLLSPRDLARACTVQRMWHSVAGDEELWQPHIWADFDAKPFTGPSDSLFGSSRCDMKCTHRAYHSGRYSAPHSQAVARSTITQHVHSCSGGAVANVFNQPNNSDLY
jgi:F-box-like